MTEGMKWYKAAREEVGPDGQVYQTGDLLKRLAGVRVQRIDLPLQFKRHAGELFGRLNEAQTTFGNARTRKDATPESIDTAYQMLEQSRRIIWRDVVQHLRDGELLNQPKDRILKDLRESKLPADFLLGAMNGFYVPGKRDRGVTPREQFQVMLSLPAAEADAMWARIVSTDPNMAKAMRPMFREVAIGRTEEERMILAMDANDGTRAKVIAQAILNLPDDNARKAKWTEWSERGLIKGQTANLLYGDPIESAKVWAEARVRQQMGTPPMPPREPNSTPPTNPGATMRRPAPVAPPPPAPAPRPSPLTQFKEGAYYQDPTTKEVRQYVNGRFVKVQP
jgi:hypothetical protein